MRVNLSNVKLKLKVVKPTKRVEPKEIPPKKLTKLVNGKVVLINGKYYCFVQYNVIYFAHREDAQAVIDNPNFREILDAIYKN